MRRALLVLMAVCLIGLTSAVASGFTANSEDLLVFETDVSIPPPCMDPVPFPHTTLYVVGPDNSNGVLQVPPPPPAANPGPQVNLVVGTLPVDQQNDGVNDAIDTPPTGASYIAWVGPTAPACGWRLKGTVTLKIDQNGMDNDLMHGALYACPPAAPIDSLTCNPPLVMAFGDQGDVGGSSFEERDLVFPTQTPAPGTEIFDQVIPPGFQLRLKVANYIGSPSTHQWQLNWGVRSSPNRASTLTIAAVP